MVICQPQNGHRERKVGQPKSDVLTTEPRCQPGSAYKDCIIIGRVKSGQTAVQLFQRAWLNNVGLGQRSTGPMSLLDTICFYRRQSGPVQYGNDSADTKKIH